MVAPISTFLDVIGLWPSRVAMARELGRGYNENMVRQWVKRDAIPEMHWRKIISTAKRCGFEGVTYAVLAGMSPGTAIKREKSNG